METKRSISVSIVCVWFVIGSAAILAQAIIPFSKFIHLLTKVYYPPLQLVWLISSLILIGYIYGGIQIFKLKEFGRSLVLFLCIIDIPHLVVGKAIFNNFGILPMYLRNAYLIPLTLVLNCLLAVFLNLADVRRQFN